MRFGTKTVIHDLSFTVGEGEVFGFLGSNGSGKTTTLRALMGMVPATGGTLRIAGAPFDPRSNQIHVGYLPEERGLYRKDLVLDVMTYFGALKLGSRTAGQRWSIDYLERVGIGALAKTRLDKLSSGQQQKVQLGVALMGSPGLLVLDEPTKGLDPVNRRLLMALVEERRAEGATVVLVTHDMEEVERLCERILLLKDGRAEAYGSVTSVRQEYGGRRIRVEVPVGVRLPASDQFRVVSQQGTTVDLEPAENATDVAILASLVAEGVPVSAFEPRLISMDEVFVRVYGYETMTELEARPAGARA